MPPYDYDSGPIVPQRLRRMTPTFSPEATESFKQFIPKTDAALRESHNAGTITDTGFTIDEQTVSFTQILNTTLEHVEAGADFTQQSNPTFVEPLLSVAIGHNHAPLAKALLDRGERPSIDDFNWFFQKPPHIQQLLLTDCQETTNSYDENVLHTAFLHEPEAVYNFCRHSVDANKKNYEGDTPLHYVFGKYNDMLLRYVLPEHAILQKVAALTWRNARLSTTNNHGQTPLDLLTRATVGFRQDVKRTAKATHQAKKAFAADSRSQKAASLLLEKNITKTLVPIVMGYVQPTWLHDIWPKIQKNAGIAKIENGNRAPAPSGMSAGTWHAPVAFA